MSDPGRPSPGFRAWLTGAPRGVVGRCAPRFRPPRRRRWRAELADGAPAVARALADALSGGHSVHGALAEAAARGGVPGAAGTELARAADALAAGERVERVLATLRARARTPAYDTL